MSKQKSNPTTFRLDTKTEELLAATAMAWGVSRADIVRMAVRHFAQCNDAVAPSDEARNVDYRIKTKKITCVGVENGRYQIKESDPNVLFVFKGRDADRFIQADPPKHNKVDKVKFDWLLAQLVVAGVIPKEVMVKHSPPAELKDIVAYIKRLIALDGKQIVVLPTKKDD